MSESTVKTHVTNIFQKLDVNDRAGPVTEAMRRGIIDSEEEGEGSRVRSPERMTSIRCLADGDALSLT